MRQFKPYFYIITFFFTTVWAPSFAAETARASKELLTLSAHFSPTEDERNSGAVVLQKHVSYKPKDNGKSETTVHSIIALLDKRAVSDYSTISLAYNEHYSSLTLEYARARNPDGPISTPSADAIQTISPTKGLIYSNDKLLQFSLPGLKPGSIIEFKYTVVQHTPLMEKGWWSNFSFYRTQPVKRQPPYRIDPVRTSTVELVARQGETLNINLIDHDKVQASQETRSDGGTNFTWTAKNLAKLVVEKNAEELRLKMPFVLVSSLETWNDIFEWGAPFYLAPPDDEIQALAASITQGIDDPQKKIEAIYNYLQKNIRYLSTNFDANGVVPHSPLKVLENTYGDCKDQSTLFSSMLRSLDIEAYPALINPHGRLEPSPDIPGLGFSHMITYVPGSDSPWIDLVGEDSIFPGMDLAYMDRHSFVFNGENVLMKTLAQMPEDTKIKIDINFDIKDSIDGVQLNLSLSGAYGNRFGQYYNQLPDTELTKLLVSIYPNTKVLSVTKTWSDEAWLVQAKLAFLNDLPRGPIRFTGGAGQIIYPFRPDLSIAQTQNRKTPFVISSPSEMILNTTISYDDSKYSLHQTHPGIDSKLAYFDIALSDESAPSRFKKTIKVNIQDNIYSPKDYERLAGEIFQASNSSNWMVSLGLKKDNKRNITSGLDSAHTPYIASSGLVLIRQQIDHGNFESALSATIKYLKEHDDNGEAHYLHGLILGFMDQYNESDTAFEKAENLGYSE